MPVLLPDRSTIKDGVNWPVISRRDDNLTCDLRFRLVTNVGISFVSTTLTAW